VARPLLTWYSTDVNIPIQPDFDNKLKVFKGKYKITITNVWGDTMAVRNVTIDDEKDVIIDFESSAIDALSQTTLHMYPNPASSTLTIDLPMTYASSDMTIECVNAIGLSKAIKASADHSKLVVPIHDMPNGLYMIRLKYGNTYIGFNKVLIEK
jgi:Secretion system C-terminal sorting domain